MSNLLEQVFEFDNHHIKTAGKYDAPWFCAKDVALSQKYEYTEDAIRIFVREEDTRTLKELLENIPPVTTLFTSNELDTIYINEFGLHSLIFSNIYPTTIAFKQWVLTTLLPTIRRRGYLQKKINNLQAELSADTPNQSTIPTSNQSVIYMKILCDFVSEITGKKFKKRDYMSLGSRISSLYQDKYNEEPEIVDRLVDGTTRKVYVYENKDWVWITNEIIDYFKSQWEALSKPIY